MTVVRFIPAAVTVLVLSAEAAVAPVHVKAGTPLHEVLAGGASVVEFESGDYSLTRTLTVPVGRGGRPGDPVVWRAAPGAKVRFVGGVRVPVSAFSPVTDPAVLAKLPPEGRGKALVADVSALIPGQIAPLKNAYADAPEPPLLYVNGKTMPFARWPNAGWTTFTNAVVTGTAPRGSTEIEQRKWKPVPGVFVYDEPRAARWDFSKGVMLNGYWTHDWDNESRRAVAREATPSNHVIRFAAPGRYGTAVGTWGLKYRRFYAFDLLEELDAPGEWHLDRERKLLYLVPPSGRFAPDDEIFLALLKDPLVDCRASEIRFEGIEFACGAGTAVSVRADGVTFARCRFAACGGTGLALSGNRLVAKDCKFADLGGCGVNLNGGDRAKLVKSGNMIENCEIRDFGVFRRTYAGAVNMEGCGHVIRGCRLHEAPHLAILYGGNEHLIESNEIFRVLRETNDAGAVYTGRDWTTMGNVLRYNFVHELGDPSSVGENGVMGFYFDDCDCGDEVYGNVFWKVPRGIMVGGGREHPIRNNVFAECNLGYSIDNRGMTWKNWNMPGTSWHLQARAERLRYREEPWRSRYPLLAKIMEDDPQEPKYDPVENNLFLDCRKVCALPGNDAKGLKALSNLVMRANLVVNTVGTNAATKGQLDARAAVRAGFRTLDGSPSAPVDLGFVDAKRGDFRLRPDARLLKEMPEFRPVR